MDILTIHNLNHAGRFDEKTIADLVPVLVKITNKTKKNLSRLNQILSNAPSKSLAAQEEINQTLQSWSDKMRRLGGIPVSLGKVRFIDNEGGWFIWEHYSDKVLRY